MNEAQSMYDVGYNDYRFSVNKYRFDDEEYIEGYEWAKECDIKQLPYADGNLLNDISISFEGNKIDVYIEKPYFDEDDNWPGFNEGDFCVISLYHTTRHYGGPEEGGWWFNWDSLEISIPTMFEPQNIVNTAKMLVEKFGDKIGGDIYSVLGGTEGWIRIERISGSAESEEVPRYE